jgi:hypothetical protein
VESNSSRVTDDDRLLYRRLWIVLLILVASVHLVLLSDHRLPRRHRTRLHYELQYALLSGCAHPGSVPLWMPYVAQGTVSNRSLFSVSGLLSSPLMLTGPATRGADFQILFHLGVFAEELLLLLGCWLLSRRYFRSPRAAFFTSVSVLGSAFWLDEMELNLHSISALPLLLELLHGYFDEGSRKSLLLAGNLAAVQALGGPPGSGLVTPLAAALYFAGRAIVLQAPRLRTPSWQPLLAGVAGAVPVLGTAFLGTGALTGTAETVGPSWSDPLVYAGLGNPLRYLDALAGVTPSLDWSVYCGALAVGMAYLAVAGMPRARLARLAVALPLALLALGTGLAFVFWCCPSLRPIRAVGFGTPVLRLFLAFLAGAGFQRILEARDSAALKSAGRLLAAGALGLVALTWTAAVNPGAARDLLEWMVAGESKEARGSAALQPWIYPESLRFSLVPDVLGSSALFAGMAGGLLLLLGSGGRKAPLAIALILVLHPLDAFGWKFRMSWLESFPANSAQQKLQRLHPATYTPRRVASIEDAPRFEEFHRSVRSGINPEYAPRTSGNWPSAGYWQADAIEGPGRAEHWMRPWGGLAIALGGTPEGGEKPSVWSPPPGAVLAGLSEDKIQYFSGATSLPREEIARRLGTTGTAGDVLYVEGDAEASSTVETDRLRLSVKILSFETDSLTLDVQAPDRGAWLSYADTWDPGWLATVNGKPREIARANLAYKALRLDPGPNRLEFRYSSALRTLSGLIVGLNLLLWLLWTLRNVASLAFRGRGMP